MTGFKSKLSGLITFLDIIHTVVEKIAKEIPDRFEPYQLANNIGKTKNGPDIL